MLWAGLIIWVISPLILIPSVIVLINKKSRLLSFLNELLSNGRISHYEYDNLTVVKQETQSLQKISDTSYEEVSVPKNEPEHTPSDSVIYERKIPQPLSTPIYEREISSSQSTSNQYNYEKSKKGISSVNILFSIGIIFVILAGFVFSTAIWVYISDFERTGIIALAGLFFFGLSAFSKKKLKLDNTSVSFYMLGTVFSAITIITAGFFELMGEWFSTSGDGSSLLFAFASLVIAGFSALAYHIYHKKTQVYFALYAILSAITMFCIQLSDSYVSFIFFINIISTSVTALFYYRNHKLNIKTEQPIKHILFVKRILYVALTLPYLLSELGGNWGIFCYLIWILYTSELSVYGILKKNKLLLSVQSMFISILFFEFFAFMSTEHINDETSCFMMSLIMFLISIAYRYTKVLHTQFSDILFASIVLICSCILTEGSTAFYGIASFIALEILIFIMAMDYKNAFYGFFRIILPFPVVMIFANISSYFDFKYDIYCEAEAFTVCSVIFILLALLCGFISKQDRRYISVKYSFEVFAGAIAIYSLTYADTIANHIWLTLISIAIFAEIRTSEKNIHSIISVISFFIAVSGIITSFEMDFQTKADILNIVSIIMCIAMTLLSRLLFNRKIHLKENGYSIWDTLSAGVIFSVFLLNISGSLSALFSSQAVIFIANLELAVFSLNLYRKENSRNFNLTALTFSAGFFTTALIQRPFFIIEDEMFERKVIFLLITLFGFIAKYIWRENKRFAENFASLVHIGVYFLLILDALSDETLFNTLIVLCTSITILFISFMNKKKRWFIISSAGLTGLTVYIMKDFFTSVGWWVYLLVAGILFISIASANEYFKSRGETIKAKAGRFFEDWSW